MIAVSRVESPDTFPDAEPLEFRLNVAFTPDPDDAYAWWAFASGRRLLAGHAIDWAARPIDEINLACAQGVYDVAAISSAAYPMLAEDYAVLSAGASVGRGYGPALAALDLLPGSRLDGELVAIPGETTTGALLLRLFYPKARTVALPCSEVAQAILDGRVRAGVLIHEELMNWADRGLKRIDCLGQRWTKRTGLPIPVGLVVARRALERDRLETINRELREGMRESMRHDDESRPWAMRFSRQTHEGIGAEYLRMFVNQDTISLGEDCLIALRRLFAMALQAGLIARLPRIEPIDAEPVEKAG